jgi:hypothetical protein
VASDTTTTVSAEVDSRLGYWTGPAPEHAEHYALPVEWKKRHQEVREGGTKFDTGKPPMSLAPRCAHEEEAKALAFGADKYGPHNWRQGFAWSRLLDAAMRHLVAFIDGEDLDHETGISHIAHLRCNTGFLLEHIKYGLGTDDRYKRGQ